MAKPNYGYKKHLMEQAKKKKREEKKRKKLDKLDTSQGETAEQEETAEQGVKNNTDAEQTGPV